MGGAEEEEEEEEEGCEGRGAYVVADFWIDDVYLMHWMSGIRIETMANREVAVYAAQTTRLQTRLVHYLVQQIVSIYLVRPLELLSELVYLGIAFRCIKPTMLFWRMYFIGLIFYSLV